MKTLGRQVRKHRQLAGMTQDDLSGRCGLYRTYLSRLENGTVSPTMAALRALAVALEVEVLDLVRE
jgi:transcriptional regulator with XRE-family HTH domain